MKKLFIIILPLFLIALSLQAQQETIDTTITADERKVILLSEMWSLDQSIRSDVNIYYNLPPEFINKMDSICFDKAYEYLRTFGWDLNIGKYEKEFGHLSTMLSAILMHNPKRIMEPEVYKLLRNEALEGRLSPNLLALFLDVYYVVYYKRTLYNSKYRLLLKNPAPLFEDRKQSDRLRKDIGLPPLPQSVFVASPKKQTEGTDKKESTKRRSKHRL